MIQNNDRALKVAEFLLQIKAVKLQPSQPFTWSSGWKSPIYCDNRVILSYPNVRTFIRQGLTEIINESFNTPELIAGVATGGIPHGVLVAQEMGLPFVYVRSKAKEHGMGNQVEGVVGSEQNTIVVEDLISTGKSSGNAINALKETEAQVKGLVSIFTYGFESADRLFKDINCPVYSLCDYNTLVDQALESDYIKKEDYNSLLKWRDNPENWQK